MKPTPRSAAYHLLSIREKQAASLATAREPAVSCPTCDTQVTPTDLPAHVRERCTGPREPGPGARWIGWREGMALGVPATTLSFWARTGQVRYLGGRMDRRYLLRDLAVKIAQRHGFRRR